MSNYVNFLDIVYLVGSVYITFNATVPTDSIGGTWEKIEDKFLQSSGTENEVESTGGISGTMSISIGYAAYHRQIVTSQNSLEDGGLMNLTCNSNITAEDTKISKSQWSHEANSNTATAHKLVNNPLMISKNIHWDNRPSYITCNMYRRTA